MPVRSRAALRSAGGLALTLFCVGPAFAGAATPPPAPARTEQRAACAAHDPLRAPFFGDTARAHRLLAGREHPGHAQRRRATPTASRAATRSAIQPYDATRRAAAQRAARPAARLRGRHRPRRADRRGRTSARRPALAGHDSLRLPALPRLAARRVLRDERAPSSSARADALRLLRRGRRRLPRSRAHVVARDPGRRRGRLRPQRRVPLHELRRLRVDGRASTRQEPAPQRDLPERARAGAADRATSRRPSAGGAVGALARECLDAATGCDVLAIPHNSNLERRPDVRDGAARDGAPIDADEARRARALEPLVEVMQHKGDSECLLGARHDRRAVRLREAPVRQLRRAASRSSASDARARVSFVREALQRGPRAGARSSA